MLIELRFLPVIVQGRKDWRDQVVGDYTDGAN